MSLPGFILYYALLIIAVTIHEFSHALVAYRLGDSTARYSGRLTINPLAHIDPVGTLILPLLLFISTRGQFVFGAAKPVPINYLALKNPRRDMILIGASGPLANLILAFALSFAWRIIPHDSVIGYLIEILIVINVVLAIFNLIPIPPLDGSRIIMGILPKKMLHFYVSLEPYGFMILIILLIAGLLNFIISPVLNFMLKILLYR